MESITRQFTWFYAVSQLRLKYRYTALGFIWNFLEPALFLGVLSLVFSVVNRMDIRDYTVFLFGALLPWRYFEKVVNTCMDSIVGGDWLLKKMYIEPVAFPLTRWIVATIELIFSFAVVFALFGVLGYGWTIHLLILPLCIVPWALLGIGIGMFSAVLYTLFRDIKPIIQMVLMLAFFSSPILFKPDIFPDDALQAIILRWHPVTYFAALFQKPVYFKEWPSADDWLVTVAVSTTAVMVGQSLLNKFKDRLYFYL